MEKISPKLLCFAVFDGHGGSVVSDFASKTIIDHIKFWLLKEDDLGVVLRQTFIDVNNMLARNLLFYSLGKKVREVGQNTSHRTLITDLLHKVRVWSYQRGKQNPLVEEGQTTQWCTKHTHKTKDWVTQTSQKNGGEILLCRVEDIAQTCYCNRYYKNVIDIIKILYTRADII